MGGEILDKQGVITFLFRAVTGERAYLPRLRFVNGTGRSKAFFYRAMCILGWLCEALKL